MTDYGGLLQRLARAGVDFVLVGGLAAIVHGGARLTQDVDVVYSRDPENLIRLAEALEGANPYLRGAPKGLPFELDVGTLRRGLNFTLNTDLGPLDLIGETAGRTYEDLAADAIEIELFGVRALCISLPRLIEVKRAVGRPKDLEVVAELETILEERAGS